MTRGKELDRGSSWEANGNNVEVQKRIKQAMNWHDLKLRLGMLSRRVGAWIWLCGTAVQLEAILEGFKAL